MTPAELAADLRARINPAYAAQLGTESYERRLCAEAIEGLIAELAAIKQAEPVAWIRPNSEGYDSAFRDASCVNYSKSTGATHWDDDGWKPLFLAAGAQTGNETPFTTKPLTDGELQELIDSNTQELKGYCDRFGNTSTTFFDKDKFARAIEAAHGIKERNQ